ncbi:MAG: hypothetical protein ACYTXY_20290, partial [Nostoc sp.]
YYTKIVPGRGCFEADKIIFLTSNSIWFTFSHIAFSLNSSKETELLHNYFDIRENDYRRWGVGSQRVFLQGWMSRAEALKKYLHV